MVERSRLWALIRLVLLLSWAPFVLWLFVYGMPLSGLHGLAGLWALWPARAPSTRARVGGALVLGAALVTVPLIGLPEYAASTNRLHCRTLGFLAREPSWDCAPEDVSEGAAAATAGAPLFSLRERLGVHGFNLLLGLGGALAGFPEVAGEAVWMSLAPDPLGEADVATRRRQCRAGTTDQVKLADTVEWQDDLPMRSARVRQAVASGLARLPTRPGARLELGEVHFSGGGSNNQGYATALRQENLRVALALEVADSRLALTRLPDGAAEATWDGTISYPGADIAFTASIPTIWGARTLRVSETVFCGMEMDGAMSPYPLRYRWRVEAEDPRLSPEGRRQSERGLLERLLAWALG